MIKRLICLLIAIILVFSMTSCSVLDIVFGKQVPHAAAYVAAAQETDNHFFHVCVLRVMPCFAHKSAAGP